MDTKQTKKTKWEGKVRLSKTGSWIFYIVLALALILFLYMYIKWRMLYG